MLQLLFQKYSARTTFEKLFAAECVALVHIRFGIDEFPWTILNLRCSATITRIVLFNSTFEVIGLSDVPTFVILIFEYVNFVHTGPRKTRLRLRLVAHVKAASHLP